MLGPELDQEVDVAAGAEVVTQGGSVEGKAADAVGAGERGEEGVVEGQARPELHTVMMPHSGDRAPVGQRRRTLPSRRLIPESTAGELRWPTKAEAIPEDLLHLKPQRAWMPCAEPAA